jgi:biopolymer transport protein TolR
MGMDLGRSAKGTRSQINITPLIDIVLVLLIIFMVATPAMRKHLSATIPPPAPPDTTSDPLSPPIVVEYTAARQLTVNHEPVAVEGLRAKMAERLGASRQKVVFFKADDEANYGEVVRLMDVVKGAGATALALAPPGDQAR